MEKRRVVVTGMGCVSPYGAGVDNLWKNVSAGKSGIKATTLDEEKHIVKIGGQVPELDTDGIVDPKEAKRMDGFILYSVVAADEALKDSKLDMTKEDPFKVGVIVSSAAGGLETISKNHEVMLERAYHKCSPFTVPMMISNMAAGKIAINIGAKGLSKSVVTACATGAHSIGDAYRSIQYGDADVIFAGGSEHSICDFSVGVFTSARTLSKSNEALDKASRPYDVSRDGFVMSEGAAVLVLEELEHAKARGAKIYAELVGYGQSTDAYDMVAPDPEGKGAEYALRYALKDAGLTPDDVDYVNTHGTSTHLGDIAESNMVARVFGDKEQNKKLLVSSTKSETGHMLGAAGAAEAIISIKTINDGIVAPTINLVEQDPEVANLDYVPNVPRKADVKVALSNSFGFGGHNAVLIFKKYE